MLSLSEKSENIRKMFDSIAPRYDFLNRLLSFGIDRGWRRKAVKFICDRDISQVLDIATGTGDVILEIARTTPPSVKITGVDFSEEMLSLGKQKIALSPYAERVDFMLASCEDLPLSDNAFDAVTIAFGIRNVENRHKGLSEMRRALRPDGKIVILELSMPRSTLFRLLYRFYFQQMLPIIGGFFSCFDAYRYLPDSVCEFPSVEDFAGAIANAGFRNVHIHELCCGAAHIFVAEK